MSSDDELSIANNNGTKQAKPPKFDLEFVNVGAISQAEKERNQRLIRSTAMKSFRRRQLSERSTESEGNSKDARKAKTHHPKSKKGSKADHQAISSISYTDLSSESFSEASWLLGGSNGRKVDYFAFVESNRSRSLSSQSSRAPSVVTSPCTPLGAGRVDPFRILPVDPGSPINELIDHCECHFNLIFSGSRC